MMLSNFMKSRELKVNRYSILWRLVFFSIFSISFARKFVAKNASRKEVSYSNDRQLIVDVSVIFKQDARSGIQRVVRAILLNLIKKPPLGYVVRPVFASRKHGYCYTPAEFGLFDGVTLDRSDIVPVTLSAGDVYLGLDLAANILHLQKMEFIKWKQLGVKMHFVVYDMLPLLSPKWFKRKTRSNFSKWIKTIAIFADGLVCISSAVKSDVDSYFRLNYSFKENTLPTTVIPLGADLFLSAPSLGMPENARKILDLFLQKPTLLIVGTIEPRKAHHQMLSAIEVLWNKNTPVQLVIVGKPGWKTNNFQKKMREHPKYGESLFWYEDISDEFLELLYIHCAGVIVGSYAEGFGLPLVEALHYEKPVFARDIPVFREIENNLVTYFSEKSSDGIAVEMNEWLFLLQSYKVQENTKPVSWETSTEILLSRIGLCN